VTSRHLAVDRTPNLTMPAGRRPSVWRTLLKDRPRASFGSTIAFEEVPMVSGTS